MKLTPIPLFPAFRHGKETPWGGSMLKSLFGKPIPDDKTGESLEMSVIPGKESVDESGVPLSALIAWYGSAMTGSGVGEVFPLLLKLIDARDRLSVQVHPDDAYAAEHENKLGKTEAWVILQAEPDAELVYGIREGTTPDMLRNACANGREIESLLRHVPVSAGDVFYIPSGMVHAIGAGILLYEIQQSSDVTYRFYDWDRTDAQGNRRQLHIRQGLDVTRLDLQPGAASPRLIADKTCKRELLLDERYFSLERLTDCRETPFLPQNTRFSVLTLLKEGMLRWEGQPGLSLPAGQTVFIPADCIPFTLTCGQCLVSAPAVP